MAVDETTESASGLEKTDRDAIAQSLRTDGFAVVRGLLDPAYCESVGREIVDTYRRLITSGWKFTGGGRLAGNLAFTPSDHGARIAGLLRESGCLTAAEDFAGGHLNTEAFVGNMNLPGSRAQEFHQDWPLPDARIVVNVALTTVTESDGPTQIIPASHGDRYTYRTLHTSKAVRRPYAFTATPGDVMVRCASTWHRGTANRSAQPRPMFGMITRPGAERVPDPPCDGPVTFASNRFYGRYALLREAAAVYGAPLLHIRRLLRVETG